MKFEQVMNSKNRRPIANHIEDFLIAGKIAKVCSAPISDRLYFIYEFIRNKFENIADYKNISLKNAKHIDE